jgi:hypothetical protein
MLFAALGTSISLPAQTQAQAPQTARQALIEMFLSHEAETFAKHLPDTALKLLPPDGGEPYSSIMLLISSFDNGRFLRSQRLETFDDGPTILMSEQSEVDKMEVAVEHDILAGENEEIELSAHFYHDGREQSLFVIPRWIFTLKQEKKIWRLIEVTAAARVPLTDPDYLRGLRQQQQEANESAALTRVGIITAAEAGYADQHPDRGYTCALPTLFAPQPKENSSDDDAEQPQAYYDPGQGRVAWSGYRFALTGCQESPGSEFQITAEPLDADTGTKTFCADQSATVKSVTGGTISACFSRGEVVSSANNAAIEPNQ